MDDISVEDVEDLDDHNADAPHWSDDGLHAFKSSKIGEGIQDSFSEIEQKVRQALENLQKGVDQEGEIKSLRNYLVETMRQRKEKIVQSFLQRLLKQLDKATDKGISNREAGEDNTRQASRMREDPDDGISVGGSKAEHNPLSDAQNGRQKIILEVGGEDREPRHNATRVNVWSSETDDGRSSMANCSSDDCNSSGQVGSPKECKIIPTFAANTCSFCLNECSEPYNLGCQHRFCTKCIRSYILDRVSQKKAVGMLCPANQCSLELPTADIQKLLTKNDFESFLEATLMAFIESDNLSFKCPNQQCQLPISRAPTEIGPVPDPMTETDSDGKLLSAETWIHFQEYRIRCRSCNTIFCASCQSIPYHKGHTCAGFIAYRNSRRCRFCDTQLTPSNTVHDPPAPALRDVCNDRECFEKMEICCDKFNPCGCPCNGVRGEDECLPCLKHVLKNEEEYCAICYVEDLGSAPCIQISAPCSHTLHYQCVKSKLSSRWPGARVSFAFLQCPTCQHPMQHPTLKDIIEPILQMQKGVVNKAMLRLEYEGRLDDPAIVNPDGMFYNDPQGFALKQYLFYMCFECNLPYFAGGYECQEADAPFDPSELVCPGCQPSSVEDCPKHGKDWLAFKCRFCCSIAAFHCWANTHFCDKCHKKGVWQQLVVFRTGKNKKKLYEYQQCPGLKTAVDEIAADLSLNTDQKEEKCRKLLAVKSLCPLGAAHPPNGLEFGLGCSMCEDKKTETRNQDAAKKAEEDNKKIKQKLKYIKQTLRDENGIDFVYSSDMDTNGVLYYLGTCGFSQPYQNPCEAGLVKVSSSGLMIDSKPASAAVGREVVRCVTKPTRNSWFMFDFLDMSLCPSCYTLRHYSSWDTECLRNWILEGSNDGNLWEPLAVHKHDTSLNKKGATKTWTLYANGSRYRMFRLIQTGRNSNNNYYLSLSGIEFYGTLYPTIEGSKDPPGAWKVFKYQRDFDANGILYYIGTNNGRGPWKNPGESGAVSVTASSLATNPPSLPAHHAVGLDVIRCCTLPKPDQWFIFDLRGRRVRPTHYSLRHYSSWDIEALRNWRFEGSVDGESWELIREHVNDSALARRGDAHTWAVTCETAYTQFRILQTGANSNDHYYLCISGFEIYGALFIPEEIPMPRGTFQLRYSYDFDTGGLFYWLGTRGKSAPWRNPAESGDVDVSCSALASNPPSAPATSLCGRSTVRCVSQPQQNMWFQVDLKGKRFVPTHYTLRHYNSWDTEALRNWNFEVSVTWMAQHISPCAKSEFVS